MSYLAQELVGLDLNSHHPHESRFHETLPVSPAAPAASLETNSSSLKRKLPLATSSGEDLDDEEGCQEPLAKRISGHKVDDPEEKRLQEREDIHYALSGFSKISLPDAPKVSSPLYRPPRQGLRRTKSDGQTAAHGYFFNKESCGYNQRCRDSPRPVSGEGFTFGTNDGMTRGRKGVEKSVSCSFMRPGSSLPPLPPPLRRTLSEPSPWPNELFPKTKVDGDGGAGEQSPNTKRLQKMKLRLREMSEWWAEVLREADGVEEEEDCRNGSNQDCNNKHNVTLVQGRTTEEEEEDMSETETEELTQEAVSVEMLGKCLSINFSCPCNKGYQILLAGKNCYYKLV